MGADEDVNINLWQTSEVQNHLLNELNGSSRVWWRGSRGLDKVAGE